MRALAPPSNPDEHPRRDEAAAGSPAENCGCALASRIGLESEAAEGFIAQKACAGAEFIAQETCDGEPYLRCGMAREKGKRAGVGSQDQGIVRTWGAALRSSG